MRRFVIDAAVLLGVIILSFYGGTVWQQSRTVRPTPVSVQKSRAPSLSPLERLQLDANCAASAQAYFNEEKNTLFDQSGYEHGYNYQLDKCFVLISYFMKPNETSNYANTTQLLYDAVSGKEYGDFRSNFGPVNGKTQDTITRCSFFEDGGNVETKCKSREGWRGYSEYMLHGW
jgi:hypothetical protein